MPSLDLFIPDRIKSKIKTLMDTVVITFDLFPTTLLIGRIRKLAN